VTQARNTQYGIHDDTSITEAGHEAAYRTVSLFREQTAKRSPSQSIQTTPAVDKSLTCRINIDSYNKGIFTLI